MKVKYNGDYYKVRLHKGAVYDVISVQYGWYEIMGEDGDQGFFPPDDFEIVGISIHAPRGGSDPAESGAPQ